MCARMYASEQPARLAFLHESRRCLAGRSIGKRCKDVLLYHPIETSSTTSSMTGLAPGPKKDGVSPTMASHTYGEVPLCDLAENPTTEESYG